MRNVGSLTGWRTGDVVRLVADLHCATKGGAYLIPGTLLRLGSFDRVQDGLECWTAWASDGGLWGLASCHAESCYGPMQKTTPRTLVFASFQTIK